MCISQDHQDSAVEDRQVQLEQQVLQDYQVLLEITVILEKPDHLDSRAIRATPVRYCLTCIP